MNTCLGVDLDSGFIAASWRPYSSRGSVGSGYSAGTTTHTLLHVVACMNVSTVNAHTGQQVVSGLSSSHFS